ncbi:MAG: VOC family protein [Pseudomonadota bacterium]
MIINQITLPCLNYDASIAFYQTLGMVQIVSVPNQYARFEMPDGNGATLSIHQTEHASKTGAIVYFDHASAAELDRHVNDLKAKGLVFHKDPEDEFWGWREARLHDPSGNEICLMFAGSIRRFPTWRIDGKTE